MSNTNSNNDTNTNTNTNTDYDTIKKQFYDFFIQRGFAEDDPVFKILDSIFEKMKTNNINYDNVFTMAWKIGLEVYNEEKNYFENNDNALKTGESILDLCKEQINKLLKKGEEIQNKVISDCEHQAHEIPQKIKTFFERIISLLPEFN